MTKEEQMAAYRAVASPEPSGMPQAGFMPGEVHLDPRLAPRVPDGAARPFAPGEYVRNPDGSWSSEVSLTVTNPAVNGGKPTVIPSMWLKDGKPYIAKDEDEAADMAKASGLPFRAYGSVDEAEKASVDREAKWQPIEKPEDARTIAPLWGSPQGTDSMKKSKISPELHALYKIVADPNATHAEKLAAIGAQGDVIRGGSADTVTPNIYGKLAPTAEQAGVENMDRVQGQGGTPGPLSPEQKAEIARMKEAEYVAPVSAPVNDGRSPAVHRSLHALRAPTVTTIAARPAAVAPVAVAEPVHRGGILGALGIRQGPFIGKGLNSPDAPGSTPETAIPVVTGADAHYGPTLEALSLIAAAKKSHAARQPTALIYDDKSDAMMTPADIIRRQATERAKPQPVAMFAEGDDIRTPEEQLLYARSKGATTISPAEDASLARTQTAPDTRLAR